MSDINIFQAQGVYQRMINVVKQSDLFKSGNGRDILDFPLNVPLEMKVLEFMKDTFEKYVSLLEVMKGKKECINDELINSVNRLNCVLLKTLEYYLKGDIYLAYRFFQHGLCLTFKTNNLPTVTVENESYYRMRAGFDKKDKTEFYPLDDDKRYLCKAERFSVSGYPCLYVGYSEKVCLKEIGGKGSIIQISQIPNKSFKLLDLTFGQDLKEEITFIKTWPLIAACYVVPYYCPLRKKTCPPDNLSFKVEYVIPQFLTLFVKRNMKDVKGIRYYSVQDVDLAPNARGANDMRNIVFFCNSHNKKEYNSFVNSFNWGVGYNIENYY